jgi:hypothetical protein
MFLSMLVFELDFWDIEIMTVLILVLTGRRGGDYQLL